jgi:hypothetical protein
MDVRIFIVISIVLAAASPALACPRGARCDATVPLRAERAQPARRELAAPTARSISLSVDRAHRAPDRSAWTMRDLPVKSRSRTLVWRAIRTKVVENLPTYRAKGMSVSLSPVVVVSDSFDSAPCIGVSGGF